MSSAVRALQYHYRTAVLSCATANLSHYASLIHACTVCRHSSFYSSKRFADVPIPPTEDWEAATGMVRKGRCLLILAETCLLH